MDFSIRNGAGDGHRLKINHENRALVASINQTGLSHHVEVHSDSYAWSIDSYNYAAGDTILLLKNADTNLKLWIEGFYMSADVDTEVTIHAPTCETPTGTEVTGINLDLGSAKSALAVAIADETTNAQANVIWRGLMSANAPCGLHVAGGIALGTNKCIAIDFATNGAACNASIHGWYH